MIMNLSQPKKSIKLFLIILLSLLILNYGKPDITGRWSSKEGNTWIQFDGDTVNFMGSEGTFIYNTKEITCYFGSRVLNFKYEMKDEALTLRINDSVITLDKSKEED